MYVFEEIVNGKKLTEIINETHENVKYLPGHKLPPNIVSVIIYVKENLLVIYIIYSLIKSVAYKLGDVGYIVEKKSVSNRWSCERRLCRTAWTLCLRLWERASPDPRP